MRPVYRTDAEKGSKNCAAARVTDMSSTFARCTSLEAPDLSGFDFSAVQVWDAFIPEEVLPGWRALFG
ncbi:MAG: hypothetical protein IJ594_00955 [Oscillospiraceae bacterium]|nr:hypothetical protein [Oscillospiraceae bacterium]